MSTFYVNFSWNGMNVKSLSLNEDVNEYLAENECLAENFSYYAIRDWFFEKGRPVPKFVRNVNFDNKYQWDYIALESQIHELCDIIPDAFGKIGSIIDCSEDDFLNIFKNKYSDDYQKCMNIYNNKINDPDSNKRILYPDELMMDARELYLTIVEPVK